MKPRQAQQEYHARAHAFDGMLERPYPEAVAPATFVELKRTGGFESSAELRDVNHRNFIRFERAYAYVIGNEGPKRRYNTLATAVVEGLNVAEVLTADRIVVRLISEHGHGTDKDQSPELSILPDGSRFENLRLLGRPVATDVCA